MISPSKWARGLHVGATGAGSRHLRPIRHRADATSVTRRLGDRAGQRPGVRAARSDSSISTHGGEGNVARTMAVDGGPNDDEVYGADGNDTLTGGTGIDIILGGNNNDQIFAADGQADQVSGNAGTDTCTRDPGIDAVFACEAVLP